MGKKKQQGHGRFTEPNRIRPKVPNDDLVPGRVIVGDADGNEWVIVGPKAEELRESMRADCPICNERDED